MTDLAKLPVTVITGFLGSGKTTLITHLMQNPGGKRLAVVVNEFGDVGVDGEILKGCAIPDCPAENIMELANGCICCTVADDFIPTIEALMALEPRPDHILIETSGLALPKPLLKAFDWPDIRSKITVDGVIALADAEAVAAGRFAPNVARGCAARADDSIDHETPLSPRCSKIRSACADIILLTKPDLAGPEGVAKAREMIAAKAPARCQWSKWPKGVVDPRVILGLEAAAEDDIDARPSHHEDHHHHDHDHDHHRADDHDHDDEHSMITAMAMIDHRGHPRAARSAGLVQRHRNAGARRTILRVKGYAAVAGKPMRLLVQAVGARVRHQFDRPWKRVRRPVRGAWW